ncbi:hypothetical protein CY34DRAFT_209934 [Suillus luteus UH-Slu-Lm8-n1]|uniref:DRBM domain-containing protein n=1 Tax=Suillus luteus UH-Slu-Lm8-n1 TaxID=930992 RepID=A0A0D0B0X9_9AGAM|nr:hypothetical protein CY34DRAFT_209934 [Suillus luteus UH-Slu-Lm8-n1]
MSRSNQANDATNALNNYLQSIGQSSALSWVDVRQGLTHQYVWTSTCRISGIPYGVGSGTHKHQARNVAASHALTALRSDQG